MSDALSLATELRRFMELRGFSPARLAQASGLPPATISRWLNERNRNPYHWEGLLDAADALDLCRVHADRLLRAAGRPSIEQLAAGARDPLLQRRLQRWLAVPRNNLPAALTSFVGRSELITEVTELLADEGVRLVTLTGHGGVGKTRLALRSARELFDLFPGGVRFVPLAPLASPEAVVPAILSTIGVAGQAGASPLDQLRGYLATRRVLLLLDNFEHLLPAASDVADLLVACAGLKVLVTSREALRVAGEVIRQVPPMPAPAPGGTRGAGAPNDALTLFEERARAVRRGFRVTDDNLRSVAEICGRLDGLPLAIELAAARCGRFEPAELLARFPSRLDLSDDAPYDPHQRHRGLRAAIDWSVQLLAPRDRALFFALSVFSGGWTQPDAAAVWPSATVEALERLRAANLVERDDATGSARYAMLETLREHALEMLAASGDLDSVRRRHAEHFLTLAASHEPYVPQSVRGNWFARMAAERGNCDAALSWALEAGDAALALRLAAGLAPFWHEHGHFHEGLAWLRIVPEMPADVPPAVLAEALNGRQLLSHSIADYPAALHSGELALALWRQLDDPRGQAVTLTYLAISSFFAGRHSQAAEQLQDAMTMWQAWGEPRGIARGLSDMAMMAVMQMQPDAGQLFEQALELYEREGDRFGQRRTLTDSGLMALLAGDIDRAVGLLERAERLGSEIVHRGLESAIAFYLGTALCFSGCFERAIACEARSLRMYDESGDILGASYALLAFAAIANRMAERPGTRREAVQRLAARAAILSGAATALQRGHNIRHNPGAEHIYRREIAGVQVKLSPPEFEAALAHGSGMTLPEAIAYALEAAEPSRSGTAAG